MSAPAAVARSICLVAAAFGAAACGAGDGGQDRATDTASARAAGSDLPRGSEHVGLNPAEFTTEIDNPWWPMTPGDRRVYRVTDPEGTEQRAVATVTDHNKQTAIGITARVVLTKVSERGELIEENHAWYAQDDRGNVWYLGELARELDDGEVTTTDGSWEAGVDRALPGVIMPARPRVGLAYREEHYEGVAEDRAEVFSLDERAEVPFGRFRDVLLIKETEGIEHALLDYKFYARGVGPVLGVEVSAGSGREELVGFSPGR